MATLPKGCREAFAQKVRTHHIHTNRMKTHAAITTSIRRGILAAGILGTFGVTALTSHAATVTWGAVTGITGDSNVSTAGTLVGAFNFNGSATTINGVAFQAFAITGNSNTVGNYTLSAGFMYTSGTGSAVAPFSNLSSSYQSLLSGAAGAGGTMTLNMSGLTVGNAYQFQTWVNDSTNHNPPGSTFKVDVASGATVTLDPNTTIGDGGLGQYVTGTFTADLTSESVTFTNSEAAVVNGFQLRLLPAASAVPEPGSALAGW